MPSNLKENSFSLMIVQPNLSGWKDSGRALKKAERLKQKDERLRRLQGLDTR